jgi:hypothetical protein
MSVHSLIGASLFCNLYRGEGHCVVHFTNYVVQISD